MSLSSGVGDLINSKNEYAITFSDNYCPMCDNLLYIEKIKIGSQELHTRYYCQNCGFNCPIHYDGENNKTPIYDNSIKKFIKSLGDAKQRRK